MKKLLFLFLFSITVVSQEVVINDSIRRTNPVIFIESFAGFGGSNGNLIGSLGGSLNYQFNKKDLLTTRFISNASFGSSYIQTSPFTVIPFLVKTEKQQELALLYGKRFTFDNYSVSLSTGISIIRRDFFRENVTYFEEVTEEYYGVPFEINIKFFKSKKSRFRAYYGIIPIGKKRISFGRSVGLKIIGNASKSGYVGFGVTYGFGWHKKY